MHTTDRMGGFISARIIETKNIESFAVISDKVEITLKPGMSFFDIDVKKYGISPIVSVSKEKMGHIYEINLSISSKNRTDLKLKPFNKMIAICKNSLGEEIVFGIPSFPLTGATSPIMSDRPEGEVGEIISLTGRQPYYPYLLNTRSV